MATRTGKLPRPERIFSVSLNKLNDKRRVMRQALSGKMQEATGAKQRIRECAEREIAGLSHLVVEVEETAAATQERGAIVTILEATVA